MEEAPRYRRDMEFVRKLLFELERTGPLVHPEQLRWSEQDTVRAEYYLAILVDSGLVSAVYDDRGYINHWRLSWQGHDFIDAVRSDTNWRKVQQVIDKAGGFTLKVLMEVAERILLAGVDGYLSP